MDIERYKRLATSKVRAGNATKAVRDTLKDVEYSKQDQYEELGEVFKPVIESRMEIKDAVDKKQDELKKRLREGQDEIVKAIEHDPQKTMSYDSKKLPKLEYDGIYDVEDTLSDDDGEEYDVQIGDDVAKRLGDTDDMISRVLVSVLLK